MTFDYENRGYADELDFPAEAAFSISPSNSVDLAHQTRAIYIGGAGMITVDMVQSGSQISFSGLSAGSVLPIRVTRVYSTGTTATQLVGLY